jgi:small-conductance mechanosensitive channel
MYDSLMLWLDQPLLGNSMKMWMAAVLVTAATFLVLSLVKRIVASRLRSLSARTATKLDDIITDMLAKTHVLFCLAVSVLAGSMLLDLGPRAGFVQKAVVVAALIQGGLWGSVFLGGLLARWRERRAQDASTAPVIIAFSFFGRLAVWATVALLVLDNLGIEVTALLAGLGVGGIAAALAVQNILGDLLASVSIVMDKPFEVGDFIVVGELMGTVEHIGLKTTRVRSLSGEQIVLSNGDLLSSRIRNFKRMSERRVVFSLGVTYQTPHTKLESIPAMVRGIIEAQKETRFDRAHFLQYGDSALIFEIVYYVTNRDYGVYMDVQQAINLAIFKRFAEEKIEFAYPTRTLYVQGMAAPKDSAGN